MAKPQHTAYQIQADFNGKESFVKMKTAEGIESFSGPVAINTSCVRAGKIRQVANRRQDQKHRLSFTTPEYGYIQFGYSKAEKMLEDVRKIAKMQFTKGERPSFFLRKITMSDFMNHAQFVNYKDNSEIKSLYKKYLLMDLLK